MDQPLRVALLTVGDPDRMTGGYLFHRRLAEAAPANGARIDFVSVPAWPLPWALAAGAAWRGSPTLRAADVVVLDSLAAAPAAPWLAARPLAAPIVAMLHQPPGGYVAPPARRALLAAFDRWAYRRCALLLAASDWLAGELAGEGVAPDRIRVVPPGKDVAQREGRPWTRHGMRMGRRAAVLCVASWLPSKGIAELLDAVAGLPDDRVVLHLVGDTAVDPPYTRRLRARLADRRLRERVLVHGVLPPADVGGMYWAADIFALPSFHETYGTAWGEAMAAGLPVVGWRAGNLPYLADDGVEAFMAPPGDIRTLAHGLHALATDGVLRRQMGAAAAERARTRPAWDAVAGTFFRALREAVSNVAAGAAAPAGRAVPATGTVPAVPAGPAAPAAPAVAGQPDAHPARLDGLGEPGG